MVERGIKRSVLGKAWAVIAWLTGIIVSLAVGFGLINNNLTIPYIPPIVTEIAGWIVVFLSLLGVLLAIIDRLKN